MSTNHSNDSVARAKQFAIHAHDSIHQKRKYTGEPYHVHCERVVAILCTVTTDASILAAAWMHDILEDVTPHNPEYSEANIRSLFGDHICDLVIELTDTSDKQGNRAARKAQDRMRLQCVSADAKTIKLADVMDNFMDIQKNDPPFAKIIAKEVRLLLPCLADGNPQLFARLTALVA